MFPMSFSHCSVIREIYFLKNQKASISRTQELCSCDLLQFLNAVFCSPSAFICSFWSAFQRHKCVLLNPNLVFDFVCLKPAKVKAKIVWNCFTCIYLNSRCLLRRSTWPTTRKTKNSSKKKNRGRWFCWWRTRRGSASRIAYGPLIIFLILVKILPEKLIIHNDFVVDFYKLFVNTLNIWYVMLKIWICNCSVFCDWLKKIMVRLFYSCIRSKQALKHIASCIKCVKLLLSEVNMMIIWNREASKMSSFSAEFLEAMLVRLKIPYPLSKARIYSCELTWKFWVWLWSSLRSQFSKSLCTNTKESILILV